MKKCIFCRTLKNEEDFNDEHVIPLAIQGYYHLKTVCAKCNGRLGQTVDPTITNHKFIEFQRHLLDIKGRSGPPNPFKGVHPVGNDPGINVTVDNIGGVFKATVIPKVNKVLDSEGFLQHIEVIIDKSDESKVEKIIDAVLKRNGINEHKITSTRTVKELKPEIHVTLEIDLKKFKAGLLKIAYEFAVDSLPEYFDDESAKQISSRLINSDLNNIVEATTFFGDGFNDKFLEPFSNLINFKNNNHYLILIGASEIGLICIIKLFNTFTIGIKLSDRSDYLSSDMIVGKNDLSLKTFQKYSSNELIDATFAPLELAFRYWFPGENEYDSFRRLEADKDFGFLYDSRDRIALYGSTGKILYDDVETKLLQPQVPRRVDNGIDQLTTEYFLDEELYIRLLPGKDLHRVVAIKTIRKRIATI